MKLKRIFKQALGVLGLVFFIVACEEDFSTLGTNIVGGVNFETDFADEFTVAAYSRNYADGVNFNGIQTSNAPAVSIGYYDDPVYGTTTGSLLAQALLSQTDPDFGNNTVIDSVVFSMPYFSDLEATDEEGNNTYTLDSIFNETGSMRLSLYRSNFFLNSFDPDSGFEDPSVFFSNDPTSFDGIEGELIFQHNAFAPDASEIILTVPVEDENGDIPNLNDRVESERLSPRLRFRLDEDNANSNIITNLLDWNEVIIAQEDQGTLLNQNTFFDYFRGLYLKAESISGTGSYFIFDPSQTNITIFYSFESNGVVVDDADFDTSGSSSIVLNLGGVNMLEYINDFSSNPIGSVNFNETQDVIQGEESLYLKGGDGSIAIIDLFGRDEDGFSEELEALRSCNVIINEANLTFFVDQDALGSAGSGTLEPERVVIYDFDNNSTLLDSSFDTTIGALGAVDTRINHLGRLVRETEGDLESEGVSYRMRITQHINNIVRNDSTNVRLALAVSQNVIDISTSIIGGLEDEEENNIVPASSVISPEGTVLHGSTSPIEAKRLKLRINYTLTEEIDPNSPCAAILGI